MHMQSGQLITEWLIFIVTLYCSLTSCNPSMTLLALFMTLPNYVHKVSRWKHAVYLVSENEEEQPSSPSVKKSEEKGVVVVHEVKCKLYVKVCFLIIRESCLFFSSCFNSAWFCSLGMFSQVTQQIRMYGKIEEWAICPLNAKRGSPRLPKSLSLQLLFEMRFVYTFSVLTYWYLFRDLT